MKNRKEYDRMKKILMLRTNKVDPDPRVEKEASAIIEMKDIKLDVHAWDRDGKYKCRLEKLKLDNGEVDIYRVGIPGNWGKGMRNNILPALKYEINVFFWLMKNVKKYDIIHACDLMTGLPALLPIKLFKKKMVYDCCDYYADSQEGPKFILNTLRRLETKVIEKSDVTILCSEKRIEQIFPAKPKKIIYIHNSPNMDNFKIDNDKNNIIKSKNNKLKLVYVGNYCENRWLLELLENVSNMDNVEMHIGGFGGLGEEIEKIAKKSNNIYTYGKLKYNDVLKLESECDCVIALYETNIKNHIYAAPNKFYEALAIGKPLLMLKNSGMSEIVEKENIGAVIEPNYDSLVLGLKKIEKLSKEKKLKKKMQTIFEEKYSWNIMKKRLKETYVNLTEDKND